MWQGQGKKEGHNFYKEIFIRKTVQTSPQVSLARTGHMSNCRGGIFILFQRQVLPVRLKGSVNCYWKCQPQSVSNIKLDAGQLCASLIPWTFCYSYTDTFCLFVFCKIYKGMVFVLCLSLHPCLVHSRQANLLNNLVMTSSSTTSFYKA